MENISYYLTNISVLTYIIIFIGGVATSFTPCVYPLIPIIIGVIGATKQKSKLKNFIMALSYCTGMAITFSALGVFAALTGKLFGQLQSSPLAHLIVGNVIILFGLAQFDIVRLPTFLLNRAGAGKVIKGTTPPAAFLMGLASGFIAAPCTAAVLGALLTFVTTKQNIFLGFSLLFTFAMGLGTLLIIIGMFTGVLATIKKSEKIMRIAQNIIGFSMILLGEYFIFKAGMLSI